MKTTSTKLSRILNNKTLGSSELALLLNDYFLSIRNKKELVVKSIKIIKKRLGHFKVINSYLNELKRILKDEEKFLTFLKKYSQKQNEKVEIIFRKIYPSIKKVKSIITLSRSKTVVDILKLLHKKNKKLKIFVCESRPKLEGRITASELAKEGIRVELITDAMMSIAISKVDIAIIGADLILKNENVINKAGSKSLAVLCKEYNKPIYVVTTRSKFTNKNKFKFRDENPNEIWKRNVKNLRIRNIYFEEVEKKFITKIFTD